VVTDPVSNSPPMAAVLINKLAAPAPNLKTNLEYGARHIVKAPE
jgi:hypothetical protein